jgi:psiF repeat-containing protein
MTRLVVLAAAAILACGSAFAADTKSDAKKTEATNPQQNKMKTCQAEAGDKKLEGKARQDYVNNCLKAKPEATSSKNKMAMCNEKTKGMSKEEANKARSECMKGS